ncbi:MAG: hypothetical protein DRO99_03465 [Candidatus Aenigmatarchaeota archaeon]|nr:MAG: hypothetical protein DRO99_03465 [Candidatus Aenigmarchaeota archaeon]
MNGDKVAVAIPDYSTYMDIDGPYFGDLVMDRLEAEHPGKFERVDMIVKGAADGSEEVVTTDHVRGRDVYVVHPLHTEPARHVMLAQQISDNLHRSDAHDVILFDLYNPYFSYDKRKGKQSLNARIVADNYRSAHIDRVFTFDPHSDLLGLSFDLDDPLEPLSLQIPLAEHFREGYPTDNVTVCSPDIGGYPRAEVFADLLNVPLIGLRKHRSEDKSDDTKVLGIVGSREDVEGKMVLLRDDVIRSAGSLMEAKAALDEAGAAGYYVVVSHLSLCGPARERLADSGIKKVIGTNTVPQEFDEHDMGLYDVLDISPIVANVIYRRSDGMSIGQYFESFRR